MTPEQRRLSEAGDRWKEWGPYVSERAWGTVREDYSASSAVWSDLPHDHARSKAYRWGEDGLAGFCDRRQLLCFALALWNGRDPIVKERAFGLDGNEGNHGEDVKEYYFYLDATPTYSYAKYLYKYPHAAFPYSILVEENRRRGRREPEFELLDTGVFDQDRYCDVFVEYAKAAPSDILIRLTVVNRGPEAAPLHLLPTVWFRNTWSWGWDDRRPQLRRESDTSILADHFSLGTYRLLLEGAPELIFTGNETNRSRLYGVENSCACVKDGINDYLVAGIGSGVSTVSGTKAAAHYHLSLLPGEQVTVRLRLTSNDASPDALLAPFEEVFAARQREADEFYDALHPAAMPDDERRLQRQALAGMLWSKQFYYYHVRRWLRGDLASARPPPERLHGRNHEWTHLRNSDILSVPDKWEFPWYASWDLAFHCITYAMVDPAFAKEQLLLLLREWYMHPNGQLPACEWNFSDVNPPVHAWAALRVYQIERERSGQADRMFLERVFHKLLLNFTWWVNRKDADGSNVFEGGFLGLDNVGVFDRSAFPPEQGRIEQSDATSWMGMYCLNLMDIALELAKENPAYEDVASKFLEHFVYIARAMNNMAGRGIQLWDRKDGFYYDVLHRPGGMAEPLRVRSMVGLIPLCAVDILESELIDRLPGFKRRMQHFIDHLPEFSDHLETLTTATNIRRILTLTNRERLRRVLHVLLDEEEFLSPFGIRSLSRYHLQSPYELQLGGVVYRVRYEPAESEAALFGGNSNWRGPVWMPVNFLLIESLRRFHDFLGPAFRVECPTGSGRWMNLEEVSGEISRRLASVFLRDSNGRRPVYGGTEKFQHDPHWRDLLLFYEHFHGENGAGLGASHQTGWTALIANLLQRMHVTCARTPE